MYPTICVLGFGKFRDQIAQFDKKDLPVNIIEYTILMSEDTVLPGELDKVDVFLSSGYNAQVLKQKVDKPVITIQSSLYDLLSAFDKARKHDPAPMLIPFQQEFTALSNIGHLLSFDLQQKCFQKPEDIDPIIMQFKASGGKCIIGTALGCERAEAAGLHSVYLHPQESVNNYFHIAAETAISLHREIQQRKEFSAIIENAGKGILLLDQNGYCTYCNQLVRTQFMTSAFENENFVGKHISTIFTNKELINCLRFNEPSYNIVCNVSDKKYVASVVPISIRNNLSGFLITTEDTSSIQAAERIVRTDLAKKGFSAKHHFYQYNTENAEFNKILARARHFSRSDECITILGETGTGKEVLAQAIHNNSKRATHPFVAVNCAALSESLLESELFGYADGAFTGAKKGGKAGLFEIAHRGTIFLDEIGDMVMPMQTKLLRVIQENELMRIGGVEIIPLDIRIIVATNQPLWELVQEHKFREDLYYRINVLELVIPPLRMRSEDIFPLFLEFISHQNPNVKEILIQHSEKAKEILCSYAWLGNVRELQNYSKMFSAIIDISQGPYHILNALSETILNRKNRLFKATPFSDDLVPSPVISSRTAESSEQNLNDLLSALSVTNGNKTKAAAYLGISRVTLWRKMKQYNLLP